MTHFGNTVIIITVCSYIDLVVLVCRITVYADKEWGILYTNRKSREAMYETNS